MHSNFNELVEKGFIDEKGRALREIAVYDVLGKESGVIQVKRTDYPKNADLVEVDCWGVGDPEAWKIIDHYDVKDGAAVLEYRVYDWGGINFDTFFDFADLPLIDSNRPYGWSDTRWFMTLGELATNPEGRAVEIELKKGSAYWYITLFSPNNWE